MARLNTAEIELPDDLAEYAEKRVRIGDYASQSELMAEAIELLRERDAAVSHSTEELRTALIEGIESGPGRYGSMSEIKTEARRRLELDQKT